MKQPRSSALLDTAVDEIVAHATAYRHHPKFRRAVVEARNLVKNYMNDLGLSRAGPCDQNLVERIACAIHTARIERGY